MAGPGLRQGHAFDEGILWDLAPTILHYLALPVPDDMDGRVLVSPSTRHGWLSILSASAKGQAKAAKERTMTWTTRR